MCDIQGVTEVDSTLKSIIDGCLENNRVSQRQLYERYASRMFAVCRRYANSDEEAEDMLMEGFMKVFKSLETYRGDSPFYPWIRSVMVNAAVSHYRSIRKFRKELNESDLYEPIEAVEEEAVTTAMDARAVIEKLQQMPETLRVVFNLRALEGHSFDRIAKMLGKNGSAVRVAYMRARNWILHELGERD